MLNPIDQLSPRIGFSVPITEKVSYNFGGGRFFQLPAYTTLGYRDENLKLVNKLNDLTYINSSQINSGFEYMYSENM